MTSLWWIDQRGNGWIISVRVSEERVGLWVGDLCNWHWSVHIDIDNVRLKRRTGSIIRDGCLVSWVHGRMFDRDRHSLRYAASTRRDLGKLGVSTPM